MLTLELAPGISVALAPERAVYWPHGATLFVADLHLGKADVFQRAGIPVPASVTQGDLERLSALLDRTGARRLVVLGDFFHAVGSRSPGVFEALAAWRSRHATVEMQVVRGNHDLHAGSPPAELDIVDAGDALAVGPFHCTHAPLDDPPLYTLCGHIHPVALLAERSGARGVRLPCFLAGPRQMILPAFSAFTGGRTVHPRPGDRLLVTTGDQLFAPPFA